MHIYLYLRLNGYVRRATAMGKKRAKHGFDERPI